MTSTNSTLVLAFETLEHLSVTSNDAASYIVAGHYRQAFASVRSAASKARALAPLIAKCRGIGACDTGVRNVRVEPLWNGSVFSIVDKVDDCLMLFSCPFRSVTKHHCDVSGELATKVSLLYMKIVSAAAIFNMALACHLQFCIAAGCHKAEALSHRARCLYEQVADLLEECQFQPNDSVVSIYLATCTNLVELYLSLGHLDALKVWKDKFIATIRKVAAAERMPWLLRCFMQLKSPFIGSFVAARAA